MAMEYRGNSHTGTVTLLDILDKVLDKGLVVAGDIRISLANVELLTVRIRLLVCSIDKAEEIGLDWWRRDGFLSSAAATDVDALRERVESLEKRLAEGRPRATAAPPGARQDAGAPRARGTRAGAPGTERPRRSRSRRPQQ